MNATMLSSGTPRPSRRGRVGIAAAAGAVALGAILTGCSSSSPSTPSTPTAIITTSVTATSAGAALKTVSNSALGTILVDSNGATVYRFDADSASPPTSHCTGSCASVWPPVVAGSGALTAQGFAQSELGTITRSDGTKQVTVDGWPVYTYTGDSAAGQTNGQKLNANGGTWWAVTTTGARASASPGAPSASASASASSTGGLY
ncbi:hypothetical protein KDL01_04630 [Actinospica durhamensis]|uniref:Lipoprotein with Yx(FWY)xxD motif n=1 Tax=Actinospica durhamensis TaxID=1508375 RepID=A0A941IL31_9ACTN|nr:hypothetical protein [Actinospica durhamensis]MBR7832530.1 hypothetical protein [Actinospica durhamensis]